MNAPESTAYNSQLIQSHIVKCIQEKKLWVLYTRWESHTHDLAKRFILQGLALISTSLV